MGRLVDVWTKLDVGELVRPDVKGVMAMGARLLGRSAPGDAVPAREGGLIAPEGLERLVSREIPFERIEGNLRNGHLYALTVSTTHVSSGRTVVYVQRHDRELPR